MPQPLFEYQVVMLKVELRNKATSYEQYAEQVNRVAAYGWRLVTVSEGKYAYFERPVTES